MRPRARIAPQLEQAQRQLDAFGADITKKNKEDDYGGLRDRFIGELAEQRLLAKTSDEMILEAVGKVLAGLVVNIAAAADALAGNDPSGADVTTVADLRKGIDKRRKLAGSELLTLYLAVDQLDLLDDLSTIEEDVSARLPEETAALLTDWDAKLATAEKKAAIAKKGHSELVEGAAGMKARLQEDAFKDAKGYRDALAGRLQACLDRAREDGDTKAAMTTLREIDAEINGAASDPAAMQKGDKEAQDAKRQAAIEAAEWKSRLSVFDKRVQEVTAWRSKPRAELEGMAKNANKTFETTGDLTAARKLLAGAERRMDYYAKYPGGQDAAIRATLPKVVEAWRKAVGDMKKAIDEVTAGVNAITDLDAAGRKEVDQQIGLLKGMINPAAFDKTAATMTEKGRDPGKMRAVREVALREAGRLLALMENDLRFQALGSNPFSTTVRGAIVAARLALLKVQYTLQTSL